MTMANILVGRESACLMTDTAGYHHNGTVLEFHAKALFSERLRIAIATAGWSDGQMFVELASLLRRSTDQGAVLNALPAFAETENDRMKSKAANATAERAGDLPEFLQFYVAAWSDDADRPAGFVCGTAGGTFGAGYTPGTLRRIGQCISPPVDLALYPPADWNGTADEAAAVGRDLALAQRNVLADDGTRRIGGQCELIRVHRGGVDASVIDRWSDRVGERIGTKRPRRWPFVGGKAA